MSNDKRWQCQGCDYTTDTYERAVEHKMATDHIIKDMQPKAPIVTERPHR